MAILQRVQPKGRTLRASDRIILQIGLPFSHFNFGSRVMRLFEEKKVLTKILTNLHFEEAAFFARKEIRNFNLVAFFEEKMKKEKGDLK